MTAARYRHDLEDPDRIIYVNATIAAHDGLRTEAGGYRPDQLRDPQEERQIDRQAITVKELCALHLTDLNGGSIIGKGGRPKKQSTIDTDTGRIHRHIAPLLGPRRVKDLDKAHINKAMRDIMAGKTAVSVRTAKLRGNPYGRDTRVDGFNVRGIDALQFRDGMRDIFSYYAGITSDPYNFERVEIVRGPASVLFGQGSIGGLVNLVSKAPGFETRGEINLVYGSYDRKEVLADVNLALSDGFAIRAVGRARDADTYVDHVPDDRVMFAPSVRWQPTPDTDVVLTGLYQEDDTGSTSQFLPIIGTFRPNPGAPGPLDRYTFVGKPGWDRYAGRSLQGMASVTHDFSDAVRLSLKARYIDSDLEYFTHYADSYSNPTDPFSVYGTDRRTIGLYADASDARMNVFSTDNNLQFNFNSGANIEHKLLVGVDYSWNKVGKRGVFGFETIDLYDIDYDALLTYDPTGPPRL